MSLEVDMSTREVAWVSADGVRTVLPDVDADRVIQIGGLPEGVGEWVVVTMHVVLPAGRVKL